MNKKKIGTFVVLLAALFYFTSNNAFAINWRYNLSDALKTAKSQNKPIMIDFYTDWCGWCKKLDNDTYTDSAVKKLAEEFICVKLDGDKERELVGKYNISGYPTIIFLSPDGTIAERFVGYRGPADFVKTMKNILEKTKKSAAPSTKAPEKPKETPKPKEASKEEETVKKPAKEKQTVSMDFVYNGYIRGKDDEDIIAQVNYKGKTYFVKKGDIFEEFEVIAIDAEKLVLETKKGQLVMEFKKPVKTY